MAFKVAKEPLVRRDALVADNRAKATTLNAAIAAFNRELAETQGSVRVRAILRGRPRLVFGIDSPPAGVTGGCGV